MTTRTARELFDEYKARVKRKDGPDFADLFAEKATMEVPSAPGGPSLLFQGRDEIRARARTRWQGSPLTFEVFERLGLVEPSPDVVIVEYEGRGKVTATGEPFTVGAVIILEAQNGLIASVREYFDPVALGKASAATATRSPREVLRRFHAAMKAKDADALADLYAEDGVHELSFAVPNAPSRLEGREKVRDFYRRGWSDHPLEIERIEDVFVHDADDGEVVVGQWRAKAKLRATGRVVEITGLLVLHVRDGKIVLTRDFMDALGVARALGKEPFARAAPATERGIDPPRVQP